MTVPQVVRKLCVLPFFVTFCARKSANSRGVSLRILVAFPGTALALPWGMFKHIDAESVGMVIMAALFVAALFLG